jgi:putative DNA primase/helicase
MMRDIRAVAQALGGDVVGGQILAPGPYHSARDRSLAVRLDPDAPDGFMICSHAGDDWRVCRDHVRSRLGLPPWEPGDEHRRSIPRQHVAKWDLAAIDEEIGHSPRAFSDDELLRIADACEVWDASRDPRGTLAERYLCEQRKLNLPDELAGPVLRFHPRCPWRDENTGYTIYVPALIAAFSSIGDDAITGIHRIALNGDGAKRGRRMLGVVCRSAIKLNPIGEELTIGEGAETAMAARQLGFAPVWALGSAGNISKFPVIEGVERLQILGEMGAASASAIQFCGRRWHKAGRKVQIVMPETGDDLNDELRAAVTS